MSSTVGITDLPSGDGKDETEYDPAEAAGWEPWRRPLTDEDRVLVSQTHFWLRQIPGPIQPKQLCRHYPRLANAIARSWHQRGLFDKLMADLTADKRGGRTGFSARIMQELHTLRAFRERRIQIESRPRATFDDF